MAGGACDLSDRTPPPSCGQTDMTEKMTFSQTTYAGGNEQIRSGGY